MGDPVRDAQYQDTNTTTTVLRRRILKRAQDSIDQVSTLIKEKIPCAGHYLTPKRLWLKRISTPNCDVVIVFPQGTEDSILLWLLSRLRQSTGLTIHVRHHASTQSSAFYVTAPSSVLLRAAEEYHLPKSLKAIKGGGVKEFYVQDFESYESSEDENNFFTSEERQWLILRLLESIRAKSSDSTAIPHLSFLKGQPIIPKCLISGVISQVFPLHDHIMLEKLQKSWVRDVLAKQPLDEITEYFGVKIGMYFAWLGHYTTALSIPAIVGMLFSLCCTGKYQAVEDIGYVLFSVFNVIWVTTYLQAWKRYSAELAFRWGTLDQRDDLLADPRPLYRGALEPSPVTGRLEAFHPSWKRHAFRYCVTVPVIILWLVTVFIVMILSLQIQDCWDNFLRIRHFPMWLGYLPKIMLAVVISVMDEAYFKVAIWLNDKVPVREFVPLAFLYRLLSSRPRPLETDFISFEGICNFRAYGWTQNGGFWYAALYRALALLLPDPKWQLAALLISRQVLGNLKESALPYILEHLRLARMSFDLWGALSPVGNRAPPGAEDQDPAEVDTAATTESQGRKHSAERRSMSQAELESSLYKYDGTFADHLEMTIQLGYVILFSSAFPSAAMCAMFNNLLEIRTDAFKLGYVCQRPFGQRVPNIGTWQNCMEYISIVAVLVNCALIGLSGQVHRMFPEMSATQTILLIVALEHIMLVIRFVITCAIPDIPGWLATEMAKIEWARREASKSTTTTSSTPEDQTYQTIGRFSVSPSHSLVTAAEDKVSNKKRGSDSREEAIKPSSISPVGTSPSSSSNASSQHKLVNISPGSIPEIPPFRPRKSKEWQPPESEGSYHLTIGPSGGVEWAKRLKEVDMHRSTDCITPKDSSSSDSDLLKNNPIWPPRPRSPVKEPPPAKPIPADPSLSDSARSISSQEADDALRAAEEAASKKTRVKQSLMKRARSVAIFSLKLKERRAREALEKANKSVTPVAAAPLPPPQCGGGELSCIPIEKLIQLEDIKNNQRPTASGTL